MMIKRNSIVRKGPIKISGKHHKLQHCYSLIRDKFINSVPETVSKKLTWVNCKETLMETILGMVPEIQQKLFFKSETIG